MSIMSCISGLESMGIGGASQMEPQVTSLDDGYCITERYAAAGAIQQVGGLDGLRVTMNFLFMNLDIYLPPVPLDLLEIMTRGLMEMVCDGRLDEGRRLRASLRHAQSQLQRGAQRTAVVTAGAFKFGDRVLFVRRPAAAPPAAAPAAAGAPPPPLYVALREGASETCAPPHFLAAASEASLLGRRLQSSSAAVTNASGPHKGLSASALAALPPVAMGTVVHVEQQQAPPDAARAAALGLRPGAAYGLITAEMCELNVDAAGYAA